MVENYSDILKMVRDISTVSPSKEAMENLRCIADLYGDRTMADELIDITKTLTQGEIRELANELYELLLNYTGDLSPLKFGWTRLQ